MLIYMMNYDPKDTFNPVNTKMTVSSQMEKGEYILKWIDIRTGQAIKQVEVGNFPAILEVPAFRDGIFGYLSKG